MLFVTSVACLYFFGLGSLILTSEKSSHLFTRCGLLLSFGILINYTLLLVGHQISTGLVLGGVLSLLGWVRFYRSSPQVQFLRSPPKIAVVLLLYLIGLFYLKIYSEGLDQWDPLSIWFFHGKMIWVNGALDRNAGWNDPSINPWSHVDYPNLIPSMAAQLAFLQGYWNGFLTKGAIFLGILPGLFWLMSFYKKNFSFVFLTLIYCFGLHPYLTDGYMDGPLAFYSGIVMLLLGRFALEKSITDFYSAICATGILLGLKNEGALFLLCIFIGFCLWIIFKKVSITSDLAVILKPFHQLFLIVLISALPFLLWVLDKKLWGLENDLKLFSTDALKRVSDRLSDGVSAMFIFKSLLFAGVKNLLGFLVGLTLLAKFRGVKIPMSAFFLFLIAFLYLGGLYCIYLLTPHDLHWHVGSSVSRVMLVFTTLISTAIFIVIAELEKT